jgi:hypothetical protein
MADKRNNQRQRALKRGVIGFAGGSFSIDCTIRNLSASGARLKVPVTVAIPDQFKLLDSHTGIRHSAKVVWRKGDELGVRFET